MVKHQRPPMETKHRQRVVDSFGIPPALMDPATEEQIRGTFAYQAAQLRDAASSFRESVKQAWRDGYRSGRRPW